MSYREPAASEAPDDAPADKPGPARAEPPPPRRDDPSLGEGRGLWGGLRELARWLGPWAAVARLIGL